MARRSNQSILREINPEYSLEGLMLKFQYFGHLVQRRRQTERTRWLAGITDSTDLSLGKLQETMKERGVWYATVHRVTEGQT